MWVLSENIAISSGGCGYSQGTLLCSGGCGYSQGTLLLAVVGVGTVREHCSAAVMGVGSQGALLLAVVGVGYSQGALLLAVIAVGRVSEHCSEAVMGVGMVREWCSAAVMGVGRVREHCFKGHCFKGHCFNGELNRRQKWSWKLRNCTNIFICMFCCMVLSRFTPQKSKISASHCAAMLVSSLPLSSRKRFSFDIVDTFATYAGLVDDPTDAACWAQNTAFVVTFFATFKHRFFSPPTNMMKN